MELLELDLQAEESPLAHLLLWYPWLPRRANHPLGAAWLVTTAEARHRLIHSPSPPTPPVLPGYCTQPQSSFHHPDLVSQHLGDWPSQDEGRQGKSWAVTETEVGDAGGERFYMKLTWEKQKACPSCTFYCSFVSILLYIHNSSRSVLLKKEMEEIEQL